MWRKDRERGIREGIAKEEKLEVCVCVGGGKGEGVGGVMRVKHAKY